MQNNSHSIKLTQEVPPLLNEWCKEITKNQPGLMLQFYAENAVLLGTLDPNLEVQHKGILKYFEMFFKKNVFKSVHVDFNVTQCGMNNIVVTSGQYTFITDKTKITARYSFVIRKCPVSETWKIINHHSSLPADKE